jgi:CelD/BcsL family acetyltransferase involved in cellulose biosynthesis
MLKVKELNSFNELENFRDSWNNILQKSKDNDIFSTWEWISCWWKHFGEGRCLRVLIAQEKDRILGIAPLMFSKYNFLYLGKLGKIEFVGSPQSDYNNFILLMKEEECMKLFFNHLIKCSDWDYLELRDIREGTLSERLSTRMCNNESLRLENRVTSLCPYIELPSSIEAFTRKLSRNLKKNLRKRMRKLCERYQVKVKTHEDFDSVEEAMNIFFNLHQKRWLSKSERGVFALKILRDFHLDVAKNFAERGWLSLHFLTVNDEPISSIYSFDYGQKKYGYLTGFDPEFRLYGVGSLLRMYVIEKSIQEGLKEYDLTRGSEHYKADWATGIRKNFEVRLIRKGLVAKMYSWTTRTKLSNILGRRFKTLNIVKG